MKPRRSMPTFLVAGLGVLAVASGLFVTSCGVSRGDWSGQRTSPSGGSQYDASPPTPYRAQGEAVAGNADPSHPGAASPAPGQTPDGFANPWLAVRADQAPGDRDLGKGAGPEPLGGWGGGNQQAAPVRRFDGYVPGFTSMAYNENSSFAIAVDTASYTALRRSVAANRRPDLANLRIEGLINAQRYQYAPPAPGSEHPLAVAAQVVVCPWNAKNRLLRVSMQAKQVSLADRPPANLVFLVDVSGSMDARDRLPVVQSMLRQLASHLDQRDRVAIVTYAGSASVVLPPTVGSDHESILQVVNTLRAGGGTNGEGGLRTAYELAKQGVGEGISTRVLLCSDGDFNVGMRDQWSLQQFIKEQAASGVLLNVYGFGYGDRRDDTLATLADYGDGTYAYVDGSSEAERLMGADLPGQLVTVAREVKSRVWFNPRVVAAWRQIGYEQRQISSQQVDDDRADGGELGAGQQVTALFELMPFTVGTDAAGNPFDAGTGNQIAVPEPAPADWAVMQVRYQPPLGGTSALVQAQPTAIGERVDADMALAVSAAGMGLLLRGDRYSGTLSWQDVHTFASYAAAGAPAPERTAFVEVVRQAAKVSGHNVGDPWGRQPAYGWPQTQANNWQR